ncbi:tyrosinase family oxidase copper chaperone [Streptomyces sp. NPDC006314]|uniref:tyrosinase family oxidase copper chaperone n=1 Tax=Streptomyces sp. NPDC006314 TaxID=3154475 RepID=UPI0033AF9D6B
MVVSVGGQSAGAEDGAGGPVRPGPAGRTRRNAARRLLACALAVVLAPMAEACRSSRPGAGPGNKSGDTAFDQTHRGSRIRGMWTPARGTAASGQWHVTVDGRPLQLMRRADDTWLSMLDHYRSYRTPVEAARAAVEELGPGRRLRDLGQDTGGAGHPHTGGRHGVRA